GSLLGGCAVEAVECGGVCVAVSGAFAFVLVAGAAVAWVGVAVGDGLFARASQQVLPRAVLVDSRRGRRLRVVCDVDELEVQVNGGHVLVTSDERFKTWHGPVGADEVDRSCDPLDLFDVHHKSNPSNRWPSTALTIWI